MSTHSGKVEHVRTELRQAQTRDHHCHWPGCNQQVPPAAWGCRPHWYSLPKPLRDKVWDAYRPGQEQTQTPSARYIEVAREVQAWITSQPPKPPKEPKHPKTTAGIGAEESMKTAAPNGGGKMRMFRPANATQAVAKPVDVPQGSQPSLFD